MDRKVSIDKLQIGMYVSRLDRPWLETPVRCQGFYIRTAKEIQVIQAHCTYVYINVNRGIGASCYLSEPQSHYYPNTIADELKEHKLSPYQDVTSLSDELEYAKESQEDTFELVENIMDSARKGKKISVVELQNSTGSMVESMIRNPDAFMWLAQLKRKDSYTYAHAIGASVLAVAFGRHLGLSKSDLENLAIGTLLFDVGKMKLPAELLLKKGVLSENEITTIKSHVSYSVSLLQNSKGINSEVIDIIANHHERFNGKGYPNGLFGKQIPVFARIAAIVDCYDAITSDRPYCLAVSQYEAIRNLYEWRDIDFQSELVEEFIQCIGIFPIGSIVELNTGEVGIVITQNRTRRLRPQILVILDRKKTPLTEPLTFDLVDHIKDRSGSSIEILRGLEPGSYGIQPGDYYL